MELFSLTTELKAPDIYKIFINPWQEWFVSSNFKQVFNIINRLFFLMLKNIS